MEILFAASSGAAHDSLIANALWAVGLGIAAACLLVWNYRCAKNEARKVLTERHLHACHWAGCTPSSIVPDCIMHNRPSTRSAARPYLRSVK